MSVVLNLVVSKVQGDLTLQVVARTPEYTENAHQLKSGPKSVTADARKCCRSNSPY